MITFFVIDLWEASFMIDQSEGKDVPIAPPPGAAGRAVARAVAEAAVEAIPGGGVLTAIWRETHPPHAEQVRQVWEKTISDRTNEHSTALERQELALLDLRAFLDARTVRKEAGQAGQLSFFRTGMISTLEKIADGDRDRSTQLALANQLAETAPQVNEIIDILTAARDILSGEPGNVEFAHRLDDVLYGQFGKVGIRERIQEVVDADLTQPYSRDLAHAICGEIDQFNQRVIALESVPTMARGT
jgi:hypothetical protein